MMIGGIKSLHSRNAKPYLETKAGFASKWKIKVSEGIRINHKILKLMKRIMMSTLCYKSGRTT